MQKITPEQASALQVELAALEKKVSAIRNKLGQFSSDQRMPEFYFGKKYYSVTLNDAGRLCTHEIEITKKLLAKHRKASCIAVRMDDNNVMRVCRIRLAHDPKKPRNTTWTEVYPSLKEALEADISYHEGEISDLKRRYEDAKSELEEAKEQLDENTEILVQLKNLLAIGRGE